MRSELGISPEHTSINRPTPPQQKRKSEVEIPRSVSYLVPLNQDPSDVPDWVLQDNDLTSWLKYTSSKDDEGVGLLVTDEIPNVAYDERYVRVLGRVDLAKRACNGYRLGMLIDQDGNISVFGILMDAALENPALADHNHEHYARAERAATQLYVNVAELQTEEAQEWIDAVFFAINHHDDDQLLSLQRKHTNESLKFSVKQGHGLAAAAMVLAMAEEYAYERGISLQEAERIMGGVAYMVMKHDEPEKLTTILDATGDAQGLHGSALRTKFKQNELALHTISKKQLFELLKQEKGKAFFDAGSRYGLTPEFEQRYARQLEVLAQDDTALLPNITEQSLKALKLSAEVVVWADLYEMVAPPYDAIYRTFLTQYSKNREFMLPKTRKFRKYVTHEMHTRKLPFAGKNASLTEWYLALIRHADGNTPPRFAKLDTDVRRIMKEFQHMIEQVEQADTRKDSLLESHYVQRMNLESAYAGLQAFREVGSRLIQGDVSVVDETVGSNLYYLCKKMLRRAGYTPEAITELKTQVRQELGLLQDGVYVHAGQAKHKKEIDMFITKTQEILGKEKPALLARLKRNIQRQITYGDNVKKSIAAKKGQGSLRTFNEIIDHIEAYARKVAEQKDIRLDWQAIKQLVHRQKNVPGTPYSTYMRTGEPGDVRTFRQQRVSWLRPKSA